MHNYSITGMRVPPEGWVVRDGGFRVEIQDDPNVEGEGEILHGEYGGTEGKFVPAGSSILFGEYNIDVKKQNGEDDPSNIIIHYESLGPILRLSEDGIFFCCRLTSDSFDDFGGGLAQGMSAPETTAGGLRVANVRNILTFPGLGFEGEAALGQ